MAITGHVYGRGLVNAASKKIDWVGDTVKASLHTNSYVPNLDTHQYLSDVSAEVTGTNYTAGGVTIASRALSYDAATHTVTFVGVNPLVYTNVTVTGARYVVVYVSTGTAATSPLWCYLDLGASQTVSGTNISIATPYGYGQMATA